MTDVLLVDDDEGFRVAARRLLAASGIEVTCEAATGHDAIAVARRVRPGLVLLDIQLPDVDGFEVARRLRDQAGRSTVVLISTREARDYGRRVGDSGADGFITKSRLSGAALRAILQRDGRNDG